MAKCRTCGAPIFFLTERPEFVGVGGYKERIGVLTECKPRPINVDPDPEGDIIIYEDPPRNCVYFGKDYAGERHRYYRRLSGFALKEHIREGKATFRIHFDTCGRRSYYHPH